MNLSDHLRKTHRIASPVDRKPLLRMARLEKRRMTETANNSSSNAPIQTTNRQTSSTLMVNGLPPHSTNEIENLLFKHEQDPNPPFSVTLPENILLNHPITQFTSPPTTKRTRPNDDHTDQMINGPLSSGKKSRLELIDGTKIPSGPHSTLTQSTKKNRKKSQSQIPSPLQHQQQQQQPQTIIKTAASGIFPQQPLPMQHMEESSDDVSISPFFSIELNIIRV